MLPLSLSAAAFSGVAPTKCQVITQIERFAAQLPPKRFTAAGRIRRSCDATAAAAAAVLRQTFFLAVEEILNAHFILACKPQF